ncbi:uncharacterized protein [Anabrus simplex]|uniref:uncharacterized protein n=1 Tax=Anabrus simplex TaxID=316456 RepID=UPI0034DD56F3
MKLLVSCVLAAAIGVAFGSGDHLYDRFILDGREDDYLLLENDAPVQDSADDDEPRPIYIGRDDQYEDEEEDEYDRVQEADIVLHSPWAPRYDPSEEYEPRCPPPAAVGSNCGAPVCTSDSDCQGTGPKKMCCHNGCVRTCAEPAPPPIEIDWVDRTSSIYDTVSRDPSLQTKTAPQHVFQAPQMVTMTGGCVLTLKQFKELAGFSKNENINRCFCEKGGVYCEVSRKPPAKD